MSTQLAINEDLIKYLQNVGYRKDPLVDELEKETKALGKVAQMQIAKEQGQFLEIIVNISQAKPCVEIGRFTGLSTLSMALALPEKGSVFALDKNQETSNIALNFFKKATQDHKIKMIIPKVLFIDEEFNEDSLEVLDVYCEPYYLQLKEGEEIQFIRFGYCRKDSQNQAIFTHK